MNEALQENNELLRKLVKQQRLRYRFFAGMVYAAGSIVGVTLIVLLLGYLLGLLEPIPVIGGWLSGIINEALQGINTEQLELLAE